VLSQVPSLRSSFKTSLRFPATNLAIMCASDWSRYAPSSNWKIWYTHWYHIWMKCRSTSMEPEPCKFSLRPLQLISWRAALLRKSWMSSSMS
jgi:hypothetical protein